MIIITSAHKLSKKKKKRKKDSTLEREREREGRDGKKKQYILLLLLFFLSVCLSVSPPPPDIKRINRLELVKTQCRKRSSNERKCILLEADEIYRLVEHAYLLFRTSVKKDIINIHLSLSLSYTHPF